MSDIYCICCKQLSGNDHKNFDDMLFIDLEDTHDIWFRFMALRDAIELIIGYTIKIDNAILCKKCFIKVESYITFRYQLVASFRRSSTSIQIHPSRRPDLDLISLESADITNTSISNTRLDSSDDSFMVFDRCHLKIRRSKEKSDIESNINVCPSEDDEILELPVEQKHYEIINISSSESEKD